MGFRVEVHPGRSGHRNPRSKPLHLQPQATTPRIPTPLTQSQEANLQRPRPSSPNPGALNLKSQKIPKAFIFQGLGFRVLYQTLSTPLLGTLVLLFEGTRVLVDPGTLRPQMGASENMCALFGGPYNKDPTILGTVLGSPPNAKTKKPGRAGCSCSRDLLDAARPGLYSEKRPQSLKP